MDIAAALMTLAALVVAYLAFVGITYWLARWMFPKIELDDADSDFELSRDIQKRIRQSKENTLRRFQQNYAVKHH